MQMTTWNVSEGLLEGLTSRSIDLNFADIPIGILTQS